MPIPCCFYWDSSVAVASYVEISDTSYAVPSYVEISDTSESSFMTQGGSSYPGFFGFPYEVCKILYLDGDYIESVNYFW